MALYKWILKNSPDLVTSVYEKPPVAIRPSALFLLDDLTYNLFHNHHFLLIAL